MSKAFPFVIPFHKVNAENYKNFCSTTGIMQFSGSVQDWLTMPSSYMIMPQPTTQTLLRMFSGIGGWKCYSTVPILLTSVHVTKT